MESESFLRHFIDRTIVFKRIEDIKERIYYWLERTPQSTVAETLEKVEKHFGFVTNHLVWKHCES